MCSPGRWDPQCRAGMTCRGDSTFADLQALFCETADRIATPALLGRLAGGGLDASPLPKGHVSWLRGELRALLTAAGKGHTPFRGDAQQAFELRLLQAMLYVARDPDARGLDHYGPGVRVGVGRVWGQP